MSMEKLMVLTDLTSLPKAIDSNYETVKAALETALKKYDGLVVTDENYKEMKETRAEIRKGIEVIHNVGKETKSKLLAPYLPFEAKVKSLESLANEKLVALDEQIKKVEENRRQAKRHDIGEYIAGAVMAAGFNLEDVHVKDHFRKFFQANPRWMNETYSMTKIKGEVDAECARCADAVRQVAEIYASDLEVVKEKAAQYVNTNGFDVGDACMRVNAFKKEEERLAEARRRDELARQKAEEAKRREEEEERMRRAREEEEERARAAAREAEKVRVERHEAPAAPVAEDRFAAARAAIRAIRGETDVPVKAVERPASHELPPVSTEGRNGNAASSAESPAPELKPTVYRMTMEFRTTCAKMRDLRTFMDENGIDYTVVESPVPVESEGTSK